MNSNAVYSGIMRHLTIAIIVPSPLPAQLNRLLLGLSLRLSYSHLLFRPTLAFPVLGVGVLGVALELLSPKKLLPGVDPPKLILFAADPPLTAFWKSGLPVLGEKGEFEVDIPRLARGLPDSGDCEPWAPKLLRGVDFW
jgi:hypothetical protein